MGIEVLPIADRTIQGFATNRLILARKSYFPYWDGQGIAPNGNVSTLGGVTSMTWYLYGADSNQSGVSVASMGSKYLNVNGKDVQDNEVKDELVNAGWILQADNVIITP